MKADKHELEMTCMDDWELRRALERMKITSVDEFEYLAVEFGTVDNLGDNQFRYITFSTSSTFLNISILKWT